MCKKRFNRLHLCLYVVGLSSHPKTDRRNRSLTPVSRPRYDTGERKLKRNCHDSMVPNQNMPSYSFHMRYNYSIWYNIQIHVWNNSIAWKNCAERFQRSVKILSNIFHVLRISSKSWPPHAMHTRVWCVLMKCNTHFTYIEDACCEIERLLNCN